MATRKLYNELAEEISTVLGYAESNPEPALRDAQVAAVRMTAGKITDALKRDNPRFDRAKFMTACGIV